MKNQNRPRRLEVYKKPVGLGDILNSNINRNREQSPTSINTNLIDIQSMVEGLLTIIFTNGIQSIEEDNIIK